MCIICWIYVYSFTISAYANVSEKCANDAPLRVRASFCCGVNRVVRTLSTHRHNQCAAIETFKGGECLMRNIHSRFKYIYIYEHQLYIQNYIHILILSISRCSRFVFIQNELSTVFNKLCWHRAQQSVNMDNFFFNYSNFILPQGNMIVEESLKKISPFKLT